MKSQISTVETSQIVAGNNDRTVFDPIAIAELATNIKQNGLIQPITVREIEGTELFEIVAGERRFRAVSLLGWSEIPAIVADLTDEEAAAVMLAENVSRSDIDPIDEARAYQSRITMYGWTVADCAEKSGKSAIHVQFRLKLLSLRPEIQHIVRSGNLQIGYARILADSDLDSDRQLIAIRHLNDNPSPSPVWFRRIVGQMFNEQSQQSLIDDGPLFSGEPDSAPSFSPICEPPHPSTTTPPTSGATVKEQIVHQISFWHQAAEDWNNLGKPFKRQECESATQALQFALALM